VLENNINHIMGTSPNILSFWIEMVP